MAHALKTFYCRGTLDTRVNPDTIGCVWTGEFDLNTLRVDGDFFESGKKNLRIQKYPDTCGRGLRVRRKYMLHVQSAVLRTLTNKRLHKTHKDDTIVFN